MKCIIKSVLYSALLLSFFSCERMIFENDKASVDPEANFEYLWNECNKKYAYFELKDIDWEQLKKKYSAQIYNGMSQDALFSVLGSMLTELKDGHTNLISPFRTSAFNVEQLGQDNFDWRIISDNYFSDGTYYHSGPFIHNFLKDKQLGYVYLSSFTGTINDISLDFILDKYKDTKGLVLDLRENGGGVADDVFLILSRFIEEPTLLGYSRIKNGPGTNDFSQPEPIYLFPWEGIRYNKKIAVLTDRGTYSAGSFTALFTKALPHMVLIGDTTGGGLGLPNGGQLPNGWFYRFSTAQALTLDGKPDYEDGVPPDIHVLFNWEDRTKDEILEQAIEELL